MLSLTLKKQYINDLVDWIEANLTDELNIDLITLKSGYSKWHMQRMFKEMTGQTLAAYTRKRRLTMSAMALRLTRMPLIDIAVRFGFDNQQNFTRVFKSHFAVTPGVFRRIPELPVKYFHGRIPACSPLERAELIERKDDLQMCGEVAEWECKFGDYVHDSEHRVADQARQFVRFVGQHVERGWLGFHYSPGNSSAEQQHVSLFQALESQYAEKLSSQQLNWTATRGLYAMIHWSGTPEQLTRFIADIYYLHLPALGVARRSGKDLLRLDFKASTPDWLVGVFSVPVTKD
ncbi:helix-turn-helix domain-containing protein [Mixta mediterraneensis]|uniref:helix-turn-helix domain-containing protein n=1 Tax=Mixta mediterraneensis TaxID=2758443 RepID=UPI001876B6EF|nr:helix-turn-helix domain-containing protein [Mixta mediterraneensis]MBE5251892.1 helix-turn-helix domain-containing protein [Mixta mediterraneensis]